jgi:hypothetical protein
MIDENQPISDTNQMRELIKQGLVMRVNSSKMTDSIEEYFTNKCKGMKGWIEPNVEYWIFPNATYKMFADKYKDEVSMITLKELMAKYD